MNWDHINLLDHMFLLLQITEILHCCFPVCHPLHLGFNPASLLHMNAEMQMNEIRKQRKLNATQGFPTLDLSQEFNTMIHMTDLQESSQETQNTTASKGGLNAYTLTHWLISNNLL